MSLNSSVKSLLFGLSVGDALGVPVEFKSRQYLRNYPVTDMIGDGTYHQTAGTWSDDSSLSFCLAEALTHTFSLDIIGQHFVEWYENNLWTPHGIVFDIGIATRIAISNLSKGVKPELAGGKEENSNGNGSLMRISPLVFYCKDKPLAERFEICRLVSSITHGHIRSVIACFYFLEFAGKLLENKDKFEIYKELQTEVTEFLYQLKIEANEIRLFNRLLKTNIYELDEKDIYSSGYVLHTLEASIWCLLTSANYKEAVLKAVNLGEDTDTTAAVCGGLAGLCYEYENIPENWINKLARKEEIENLCSRFAKAMEK